MLNQIFKRSLGRFFHWRTPSPTVSPTARRVMDARLTYLSKEKLAIIENALADVARAGVPGAFLECGIALGGSAIVIAAFMEPGREFHGYDVFGMIPPPTSDKDDDKSKARFETIKRGQSRGIGAGDTYYGYVDGLYQRVLDNFSQFGHPVDGDRVSLHKGLFEETLQLSGAVAFAHIDCDWYDPVKVCLQRLVPLLSRGGYVVIDDYDTYGGCRRATDEILEGHHDLEVVVQAPSLVFRRR